MIPLRFGLFWAGEKLSYLRYLTFKTLRHHHPDAKIQLCLVKDYSIKTQKWSNESQDFEKKIDIKNYLDELPKLNVEIINAKYVGSPDLPPNVQSDIFRWVWLRDSKNYSFYLDVDQIILKPFDTLPLDKEFIYIRYNEIQCGDYLPCGVIFIEEGSKIPDIAVKCVLERYRPDDYNSSGPWAMRNLINSIDLSRSFNAPYNYFYPINSSAFVNFIYDGKYMPDSKSYSMHWYGGSKLSQKFNQEYTEEMARESNDSVSKIIREQGLV